MKHYILLTKAVALIYQESKLNNNDVSDETLFLAKDILKSVGTIDVGIGVNYEALAAEGLKNILYEMLNNPKDYVYSKTYLLERMRLAATQIDDYLDILDNFINDNLNDKEKFDLISNLKSSLNTYFQLKTIDDVLGKASYMFKFKREDIDDVKNFIDKTISDLTSLSDQLSYVDKKDVAEIGSLDFSDVDSVLKILDKVNLKQDYNSFYTTGWTGLNEMTQGGLRPGECVVVSALQHNYKTGFTLSLFSQLATLNKPKTTDPTKKPLIVRISFEDSLENNLQFLYIYNKYNESGIDVNIGDTTKEEMASYLKEKLEKTGFHIKLLRIDPTQYSYANLIKKLNSLEKEGYAIEILVLDYLLMIPTVGCITTGPIGSDKRDLLRRIRNYCGAKNILFITPQQLSTEAKLLIRTGVSEDKFVSDIAGKGYFDGCRTLDNEIDLELYIHKALDRNKKAYLTVQRGKHRVPGIIPESHKYFVLKFPEKMPIPEDKLDSSVLRKIPLEEFRTDNEVNDFYDLTF